MTPAAPSTPPAIADYALLRLIGRGSYGDVWLAHGVTGLYRAIKVVWRARFADAQPYEREFKGLREFARVSLEESRQLALLHVGRGEDFFYYVMELADDAATGREVEPARYVPHTLRETLARRGRLPATEVLALAIDLARALAGLHTRGLVHRDIKPSNVIFVGGVPKLADIGLVATASAELTFVGTEGYVPPEGPGAPSADVFSLGKLLYELATGLDRKDYPRLPADFHTFTDRKALLELNEVLIRACELDATRRHKDASVLLEELLLLQAGKSVRRLRAAERHLGRALRVAAALAVIAAVAGTGAWIAQRRAAEEMRLREKAETERDTIARKSVYSATLARAQRALETEESGLARRLLQTLVPKPGDSDLRNFEWRVMWREAQGDPALVAHAGEIIKRIALSPDERLVAGQVGDGRTVIWDAATLKELRTIPGTRLIGGFSADGQWLVGTNRSQALQRWRLATGEADDRAAPGFNFPAMPLEGNRVLGLINDQSARAVGIRVWNFSLGREDDSLPIAVPDPGNWQFMPYPAATVDGTRCAIAIRNPRAPDAGWRLQVYDVVARRLLHEPTPAVRTTALALSTDGQKLAVAAADAGTVQLHDLSRNAMRWEHPARMTFIQTLRFSGDGTRLLVGGEGSVLRMLDANDGQQLAEFRGHDVGVVDVCWGHDGRKFFSADTGGNLRRWDARPPTSRSATLRKGYWTEKWIDMNQTRSVCVSADGQWFAAPETKNILRLARVSGGSSERRIEGSFPLGFTADNTRLSVLTMEGILKEFDLGQECKVVRETSLLTPADAPLNFAALSADRETLVASAQSGKLWTWHFPSGKLIVETDWKRASVWSALSPSGKLVALAARDNVVHVLATATGVAVGEAAGGGSRRGIFSAAFSPDERQLAVCTENGLVEIRALPSFEITQQLRTDSTTLYSLQFSPDGTRLYCGGSNGTVQVYATDDWRLIVTLRSPPSAQYRDTTVLTMGINASGTALLGYRADGTIRIWNSVTPN